MIEMHVLIVKFPKRENLLSPSPKTIYQKIVIIEPIKNMEERIWLNNKK